MLSRPTYIVTGGAGFVGSNLVAALLVREPRPHVVVIDNFRSGSFANITEACERRGAGVFDGTIVPESTAAIVWQLVLEEHPAQAVFHLGAVTDTTVMDEPLMIHENTNGFDELIRACAASGTPLVYASSAATYGTPSQTRDRVPFPVAAAGRPSNVYGFSKWLMECEHRRFAEAHAPEDPAHTVGLRYFNVFGPGEQRKGKMASMVYQLAVQMLAGKQPRVFSDGSQARDQVYIDDVVDCTIAASAPGAKPGVYNLGSGVATSFNQLIGAVRTALEISEAERPTEYFEMPAPIRAFYQDYTCADMTETFAGLGWKPRWKPEKAIGEYAAWLKRTWRPS